MDTGGTQLLHGHGLALPGAAADLLVAGDHHVAVHQATDAQRKAGDGAAVHHVDDAGGGSRTAAHTGDDPGVLRLVDLNGGAESTGGGHGGQTVLAGQGVVDNRRALGQSSQHGGTNGMALGAGDDHVAGQSTFTGISIHNGVLLLS